MNLGEFIDLLCWYHHISQTELAKKIGVSARVANSIIHNEYRITPAILAKIGKTFCVPLEILFAWQGLEIVKSKAYEQTIKK